MSPTESLLHWVDRLHGKARYFVASIAMMGTLLVGSSLVAWQASEEQKSLSQAHAQTLQILRAAQGTRIATLDALRAQRGYLLTGEIDYLEPYLNARNDLTANLEKLDSITPDGSGNHGIVRQLRDAAQVFLAQMGHVIAIARGGDIERARQLVREAGVHDGVVTIDTGVNRIIQDERIRLFALTAHVEQVTVTMLRFIYVMTFAGLCLLGIAVLSAMALRRSSERERVYREELRKRAETDELTGIANRRQLLSYLDQRIAEARRTGTPLSFAMFDIDNFKRVNDNYGHAVGDEAIKHVVDVAQGAVRVNDRIGRMGGEEFGVVLPRSSEENAYHVCERMCGRLRDHRFSIAEEQYLLVTISTGVASLTDADDAASLIERADKALYEAKRSGRDQVKRAA